MCEHDEVVSDQLSHPLNDQAAYFRDNPTEFFGNEPLDGFLIRLAELDFFECAGERLFIDVGSCVGEFANTLVERWAGDGSYFVLIEPNPPNARYLYERFKRPDVRVVEVALSNKTGSAALSTISDHPENAAGYSLASLRGDGDKIATVMIHRLDDLITGLNLNDRLIPLLKVDTEGLELEVLQGAGDLLRLTNMVIFEASDCLDDRRGPGVTAPLKTIVELLDSFGLMTYKIGKDRLVQLSNEGWDDVYEQNKFHSNCVAMRPEQIDIGQLCAADGVFFTPFDSLDKPADQRT